MKIFSENEEILEYIENRKNSYVKTFKDIKNKTLIDKLKEYKTPIICGIVVLMMQSYNLGVNSLKNYLKDGKITNINSLFLDEVDKNVSYNTEKLEGFINECENLQPGIVLELNSLPINESKVVFSKNINTGEIDCYINSNIIETREDGKTILHYIYYDLGRANVKISVAEKEAKIASYSKLPKDFKNKVTNFIISGYKKIEDVTYKDYLKHNGTYGKDIITNIEDSYALISKYTDGLKGISGGITKFEVIDEQVIIYYIDGRVEFIRNTPDHKIVKYNDLSVINRKFIADKYKDKILKELANKSNETINNFKSKKYSKAKI